MLPLKVVSGLSQGADSSTKQGTTTFTTLNLSNPNQQPQFLIPIQTTSGKQQNQQILFQPLQQKVVSFTPTVTSFAPPLNSLLQVNYSQILPTVPQRSLCLNIIF